MTSPKPFRVAIADDVIHDLHARLDAVRLPPAVGGVGWDRGVPPAELADWLKRWRGFD